MKIMKLSKFLLIIVLFIVGCTSAKFEIKSENTAYLEFRRGFPVSENETCQALKKIHEFCPSGMYEVNTLSSNWGGQYYRVYKMEIICDPTGKKIIDKKDDSYFLSKLSESNLPLNCD